MIANLESAFERWTALADELPADAFTMRLPVHSNSIGAQFWCLVGARESYTRAIVAGEWSGFSCSLGPGDIVGRPGIVNGLAQSAQACKDALAGLDWTSAREALLLSLLEHEIQHQGQLIRYLYGLELPIPAVWRKRWSLD